MYAVVGAWCMHVNISNKLMYLTNFIKKEKRKTKHLEGVCFFVEINLFSKLRLFVILLFIIYYRLFIK